MVVVGELQSGRAGLLRRLVEVGGDLLVAVDPGALLHGDPGDHHVLVTDHVGRVEPFVPGVGRGRGDVGRRRGEAVAVEHGADFRGRLLEVARELDLLVPARGHARDRALDVFLHFLTHGVELQADALDMRARQARQAWQPGRHGRAAQQLEKTAAIAHGSRLLGVGEGTRSTRAGPAARRPRGLGALTGVVGCVCLCIFLHKQ